MKKQQLIILVSGFVLLVVLYFYGNTIPPKPTSSLQPGNNSSHNAASDIIISAKKNITEQQSAYLAQLENSVVRGNVKEQQVTVYKQLADYWSDSLNHAEIGAYYLGEQAKLENSEKKLNFAAHLLLEHLLAEGNPALQKWMATNAKDLLEQSLKINPANDSAKVELGACYIFGNISASPMEGILKIKEVANRDPHNMYAQLILGLGDIRSGQYDKAVERLKIVIQHEPVNLQAVFNLAETYERKGDNANAVKWYRQAQKIINIPAAKLEIEERIKTLQ